MATTAVTLYHCFVFIWYVFLTYLFFTLSTTDQPDGVFLYGGLWKYLTILNVVLQTVFYAICFVTDLLMSVPGVKLVNYIVSCRDLVFSVLAFPASTFVFLAFWALYSYDKQLVYPDGLDKIIPLWLNHAVHTAVFPLAVVEMVTSPHRYPPKKKGLLLLGLCSVCYLSWVLWIYFADGKWVYPFLGLLSPFEFIMFSFSSNVVAGSVYIAGEAFNHLLWGEIEHKKKQIKYLM